MIAEVPRVSRVLRSGCAGFAQCERLGACLLRSTSKPWKPRCRATLRHEAQSAEAVLACRVRVRSWFAPVLRTAPIKVPFKSLETTFDQPVCGKPSDVLKFSA